MDSVEILMPLSAWWWHGVPMTTIGGAGRQPGGAARVPGPALASGLTVLSSAVSLLGRAPIVIRDSPARPLLGGVQRVVCADVMVVLVRTARATRGAIDAARTAGAAVVDGCVISSGPAGAARTHRIDAAGAGAGATDTVPDPAATAAAVPGAELRSAA